MPYQLQFNIFSTNYSHVSSQDAEVSGVIVALQVAIHRYKADNVRIT